MGWEDTHKYDDIIDLPHHVSGKRSPMSLQDRAAQFAPFAALTGYEAVIRETGRLTDTRMDLDESAKAALNEKLQIILEDIAAQPQVTVTYFQADERKAGGAYMTVMGKVKKLDPYEHTLIFTDGAAIAIDDIVNIAIADFDALNDFIHG